MVQQFMAAGLITFCFAITSLASVGAASAVSFLAFSARDYWRINKVRFSVVVIVFFIIIFKLYTLYKLFEVMLFSPDPRRNRFTFDVQLNVN